MIFYTIPYFSLFMIMKYFLSLCVFFPWALFSQQTDDKMVALDDLYPGQNVTTFDLRQRSESGQTFFNEEWMTGQFVFDDGSFSKRTYFLKNNIQSQELLVNLEGSVYLVPTENLSGFLLKGVLPENAGFLNHEFEFKTIAGKSGRTILEKKVDGAFKLYFYYDVKALKPNYVPALDAGDINTKYVKNNVYYLESGGNFKEIPKNRKKAEKFFGKYAEAKAYMKGQKMKIKSETYLIDLVNFMNQNLN